MTRATRSSCRRENAATCSSVSSLVLLALLIALQLLRSIAVLRIGDGDRSAARLSVLCVGEARRALSVLTVLSLSCALVAA